MTQVVSPPPSYQLVVSPTALELKAGATANNSATATVKALYGFTGTVSLSCKVSYLGSGTDSNPPTCGFGTSTLPVKGADVSTQLIVSTTVATAADRRLEGEGSIGKTSIVLWGGILLLLLPRRLRSRWLTTGMIVLVLSGSMLSLSSCGGTAEVQLPPPGSPGVPIPPPSPPAPPPGAPGTQAGSYVITVSASSDTTAPAPPPVSVQLTVD